MQIIFLKTAEYEFNEAIEYYNLQRDGLGYDFEDEVKQTIKRIQENPEAWATVSMSKRTRRCQTDRIPYGIIYQVRGNILLIIAVMHLRRHPKTWQSRLPKKSL